jgi:hypothetical protein
MVRESTFDSVTKTQISNRFFGDILRSGESVQKFVLVAQRMERYESHRYFGIAK